MKIKSKILKTLGIEEETVETFSTIKIDGITEMNITIKGNRNFSENMSIETLEKELNKVDEFVLNFNAKCSCNFAEDFMHFLRNRSSEKDKY